MSQSLRLVAMARDRPYARQSANLRQTSEGADWMGFGSYLMARRIRISLEHWDRSAVDFRSRSSAAANTSGALS